MIDIINDLIDMARKGIPELNNRVYLSYPQKLIRKKAFITVAHSGHVPTLTEDGNEIQAALAYAVNIYAPTPAEVDKLTHRLTSIYNAKNIACAGMTPAYMYDSDVWVSQLTYTATVDIRGHVFRQ